MLLGGGYVTLHAYRSVVRRLGRAVQRGEVEIVVISPDPSHRFHGFTGELIAGMVDRDRLATPLIQAMPLARVIIGRVVGVDPDGRRVSFRIGGDDAFSTLTYDHLVIGTGAKEPTSEVPGLDRYGFTLRGPDEIGRLADHLAAEPGSPVVVAGGGIAGVELAAAIGDRGHPVTLVSSRERLLAEWSDQPRLVARAEAELPRLGVTVVAGVRVAEVTPTAIRFADGRTLPARTVVAATGQRPVGIAGLESLHDERGRLRTSDTLAVTEGVWAAGDAARVAHPVTGDPVAANALWAIKGGGQIGRAIAAELSGGRAARFGYRGLGRAGSLGLGKGIAELYGVPMTGVLAWTMRLVFFLRFMPSRRRAAGVVADIVRFVATSPSPVGRTSPARAALTPERA